MFQNGQTRIKNLAANAARFFKCVSLLCIKGLKYDIQDWRIRDTELMIFTGVVKKEILILSFFKLFFSRSFGTCFSLARNETCYEIKPILFPRVMFVYNIVEGRTCGCIFDLLLTWTRSCNSNVWIT